MSFKRGFVLQGKFSKIDGKIPVVIITGFLGSGKTTLLNNILTNPNGNKYAVIVNEFGEIGIDNDLVIGADEEVFELSNGCVCCNVRGDLIRVLGSLFKRRNAFDAILVETTGLANPAPIAQTFFADDDLARKSAIHSIVTVVDAVHILGNLEEFEEAINQIAFADIIILNKKSEVDLKTLQKVRNAIISINKGVKIIETDNSIINMDEILLKPAFDPKLNDDISSYFEQKTKHEHHHHHEHEGHECGPDCNHDHHHEHHHHDEHDHDHECGPDCDHEDHKHNHFDGVEALAMHTNKPIKEEKFTKWLSAIIDIYGPQMLRFKGIINIENNNKKFVVNGVHQMVEADYAGEWKEGENSETRMVIIGKELPKPELMAGFESCAK